MSKEEETYTKKLLLMTPELAEWLRNEAHNSKKSQSQIAREALIMYKAIKANLT